MAFSAGGIGGAIYNPTNDLLPGALAMDARSHPRGHEHI